MKRYIEKEVLDIFVNKTTIISKFHETIELLGFLFYIVTNLPKLTGRKVPRSKRFNIHCIAWSAQIKDPFKVKL